MPATVNRELACLRAMINHFIRDDVLVKNPVSRVKFLKEDNEQKRVIFPDEERLYDLRHTFVTRAAEAGVDIMTLAALLGHSRVQMVMRYAHPTEEHQFNAVKKIEIYRSALS